MDASTSPAPTWPQRMAALCGGLAVALGAFGAHGFQGRLKELGTAETYHTAVLYHFLHALMLVVLSGRIPVQKGPYLSFLIGILIFSGSLYVLALTGQRWLGAITPFGGVAFLVGWCCLAIAPRKQS